MVTIKGSMLTDVLNRILNSLIKGIDDLITEGDWDTKEENIKDNNKLGTKTTYTRKTWPNGDDVTDPEENILSVEWVLPVEGELTDEFAKELMKNKNIWEDATNLIVIMKYNSTELVKEEGMSLKDASKLYDKIKKQYSINAEATQIIICQYILGDGENVNSSKYLKMSLTKITGNKEIEIKLNKITANYDLAEAVEDVNAIVSDDTFIETLSDDTETCYEVIHEDSEYDINQCEDFTVSQSISDVITESIKTQLEIKLMSLTYKGNQYDEVVSLCDTICYEIDTILRSLSDTLIVDKEYTYSPELVVLPENYLITDDAIQIIDMKMQTYLKLIDAIYIDCSKGIQSQLDWSIQNIENSLRKLKRRN